MSVIHHRKPSLLSYPIWLAGRVVLKPLLSVWPLNGPGMAGLFLVDKVCAATGVPGGVMSQRVTLGQCRAELIMPRGPSGRDAATAILYLHGGAFVIGGVGTHRSVAAQLCRAARLPVFSLVYRQLPAAGAGTSVSDAMDAYRELITERGYRRVVVAGDSAGGFLAAKIVEGAAAEGLAAPTAVIGFSPLLDLDLGSNPDRSSRSDAYLPKARMVTLVRHLLRGPQPFRGVRRIADLDLEHFPPTILITAEDELLEPDAFELVDSLAAAGVDAVAHSYSWQIHAFAVLGPRHRESVDAVEESAAFAGRVIREARDADDPESQRAG